MLAVGKSEYWQGEFHSWSSIRDSGMENTEEGYAGV